LLQTFRLTDLEQFSCECKHQTASAKREARGVGGRGGQGPVKAKIPKKYPPATAGGTDKTLPQDDADRSNNQLKTALFHFNAHRDHPDLKLLTLFGITFRVGPIT
jgi:hypothetical protein